MKNIYLPIASFNLGHYFSRGCICPTRYISNRNEDIQNRFDNSLLFCQTKFTDETNCSLEIVLTKDSRKWFDHNLGINNLNSSFIDFYSFFIGGCGPRAEADCLYTLEEILENYKKPYWKSDYPNIEKKFEENTQSSR